MEFHLTGVEARLAIIGFFAFILIFFILFIISFVKKIKRTITDAKVAIDTFKTFTENKEPEIKSVGGSNAMYLPRIQKDFPEFHLSDAELAISAFIDEYLRFKYKNIDKFSESYLDPLLDNTINKLEFANISDIIINKISIFSYIKTEDYATIIFNVSVGYNQDDIRKETRYEVDYTFKLKENNIKSKALSCPNCNGKLPDSSVKVCPYCGAKVIMDTIMSWQFSRIKEK